MPMPLNRLRSSCENRKIPIISQATENFLKEFLETHQPKTCLEIGGAVWYSSFFVASLINKWQGKIYSFEISYPAYLEWLSNTSSVKNLVLYPFDFTKAKSQKLVYNQLDFIFIDWQKKQYIDYIKNLENKIWPETMIVLDDVIKYHSKLSKLYEYLSKKQIHYKILQLEEDDGIMVIEKYHS